MAVPEASKTCRCSQCLYHFTQGSERLHQLERVRNLAVAMYGEGSSMVSIGRVLGVKLGIIADDQRAAATLNQWLIAIRPPIDVNFRTILR